MTLCSLIFPPFATRKISKIFLSQLPLILSVTGTYQLLNGGSWTILSGTSPCLLNNQKNYRDDWPRYSSSVDDRLCRRAPVSPIGLTLVSLETLRWILLNLFPLCVTHSHTTTISSHIPVGSHPNLWPYHVIYLLGIGLLAITIVDSICV